MSDVEYTVMDNWYRLLNNEIPESPTGFDLSADLIGELVSFKFNSRKYLYNNPINSIQAKTIFKQI